VTLRDPSDAEWKLVLDFIEERYGLAFDGARRDFLATRLFPHLAERRIGSLSEYYRHLRFHPDRDFAISALADAITNNETYFFREWPQVCAFARYAASKASGRAPVHVLSAGCSSGEEAYSIGIALREALGPTASFRVHGCDVSGARLRQARDAVYHPPSLRACSESDRDRYFVSREDGRSALRPAYREHVEFFATNLAAPNAEWFGRAYDAIFCRNVLIYFSERALHRAVSLLAGALAPDGRLFLGHSESLIHRREDLVPELLEQSVVYTKGDR
jgi:chemotaxis protein methyltransferase CheR